jgi:hypothetical protein
MRRAFQKVCHALRINGDVNDPMTELIVTKIVGLAKAGDYDPDRLCSKVLISMGMGHPSFQINLQCCTRKWWAPGGGYREECVIVSSQQHETRFRCFSSSYETPGGKRTDSVGDGGAAPCGRIHILVSRDNRRSNSSLALETSD